MSQCVKRCDERFIDAEVDYFQILGKSKGIAGRVYRKRKQRDDPDDEADHKGHKNSESEDTDER